MSKVKFPQAEFRLPRGRLVRGSTTTKTTTNHQNQPLPENKHHYWIAMAVEKNAPGINEIINGIVAHTWQSYQNVAGSQPVMQQIQMLLAAPAFAWKIDDGDMDAKWSQREGCRGCYIFQMSTTFNLNLFDAANAQLDPKAFQLGDYIDAYIGVAINGEVGNTAGIFINPLGIRWLGEGPRITAGRDAASMFGAPAGPGYVAPQAAPMSHQVMGGASAPHSTPQPGMAGPAPGAMHPEPAEAVAARYGVPHHPGWRYNPAMSGYEVDAHPTPVAPPATPQAPAPGMATYPSSPNGHVNAPVAPVGVPQPPHVGSVAHGGPQATAYPSNPYGPGNPPPGVQPHAGFAGGPPRVG